MIIKLSTNFTIIKGDLFVLKLSNTPCINLHNSIQLIDLCTMNGTLLPSSSQFPNALSVLRNLYARDKLFLKFFVLYTESKVLRKEKEFLKFFIDRIKSITHYIQGSSIYEYFFMSEWDDVLVCRGKYELEDKEDVFSKLVYKTEEEQSIVVPPVISESSFSLLVDKIDCEQSEGLMALASSAKDAYELRDMLQRCGAKDLVIASKEDLLDASHIAGDLMFKRSTALFKTMLRTFYKDKALYEKKLNIFLNELAEESKP